MIDVNRVIGTETEYALQDPAHPQADPQEMALSLLHAWALREADTSPSSFHVPDPNAEKADWAMLKGAGCRFDYSGEHPEADATGEENLNLPAEARTNEEPGAVLTGASTRWVARVGKFGLHYYRGSATHAPNGARLYVDHTHPEYASAECLGPFEAALYDRGGDALFSRALTAYNQEPAPDGVQRQAVIVKNNTDGKGAAWGGHENYLMSRKTSWELLVKVMMPFLVTRQIIGGGGKLGLGQHNEQAGFQIFQRADFIEDTISLFTTRQRPIINTRDEPHSSPSKYRRFHVITADCTLLAPTTILRLGSAALVLDFLERYPQLAGDLAQKWSLVDPVAAVKTYSRDVSLQVKCDLAVGGSASALEVQRGYLHAIKQVASGCDEDTTRVIELWQSALDCLEAGYQQAAGLVEWCAKLSLLERIRQRYDCGWDDLRLAAADLKFSMLDENAFAQVLERKGAIEKVFDPQEIQRASNYAPPDTRAGGRAAIFRAFPNRVWGASWTSLLVDIDATHLLRVSLPDPMHPTTSEVENALSGMDLGREPSAQDLIRVLQRLGLEIPEELQTFDWDGGFYAQGSFGSETETHKTVKPGQAPD